MSIPRSVMRGLAACGVAIVLVAAAAGCGESDDARYERELRAAVEAVPTVEPGSAGARDVQGVSDSLEAAAERLAQVDPPPKWEQEHAQLVDGVRAMASDARLLAEAQDVVERDPDRARELTRQAAESDSLARVTDAAAKLRDGGIDVDL